MTTARINRRLLVPVGELGLVAAIVLVARDDQAEPFSNLDREWSGEIGQHAHGALARSRASAQAAEVETLRELDRQKTEFMDIVSHDLQNPITIVRGFAEILHTRSGVLDPAAVANMASMINSAAMTGQQLIDDLLTTARLERGGLTLRRERIELREFLTRLARGYQILPQGDRLHVEVHEETLVSADAVRLEQMISNLITNAMRYAMSGPILLRAHETAGLEVRIEVRDFGPGIAIEDQPHVWKKFYRTASGARLARGTGVGLAVVRTLADLHGGRVELESTLGKGSTFRIVLPATGPKAEVCEADLSEPDAPAAMIVVGETRPAYRGRRPTPSRPRQP